ncbi:hypothetical protein [Ottowia sp.]|uniref:hypothetical protein n=1 Tax=Ottowia sp. TaxID=1898956 RepID=UPI0025D205FD|nr:hypothetical protein [Ottowia sp.]
MPCRSSRTSPASACGQSGYLALYHWDRPHHTVRVLRIHHQREAGYADDEV